MSGEAPQDWNPSHSNVWGGLFQGKGDWNPGHSPLFAGIGSQKDGPQFGQYPGGGAPTTGGAPTAPPTPAASAPPPTVTPAPTAQTTAPGGGGSNNSPLGGPNGSSLFNPAQFMANPVKQSNPSALQMAYLSTLNGGIQAGNQGQTF